MIHILNRFKIMNKLTLQIQNTLELKLHSQIQFTFLSS